MNTRSAAVVMTAERAGASVSNALSFTRTAMRELLRGRWQIVKDKVELDAEGRGEVLYRLVGHGWTFHFFLVSTKLPEELKMDRNFAQSWDAMGVLCQGEWTAEREAYLRQEVPKQRAGRADYDTLMYARGNRSGRLFEHVVESLAAGRQPDIAQIARIGYILRTTAFIGNGQLGTRPLAGYGADHPMQRPYHAQMWSAFMLREYVFDLVDHMARARNPRAAQLDPAFRRYLGLGNSAATGLAAYVATHPRQIDRWCSTHEQAIAQARSRAAVSPQLVKRFEALCGKAIRYYEEGRQEGDGVFTSASEVASGLRRAMGFFAERKADGRTGGALPWNELGVWIEDNACAETLEVFNAILLDMYPDIVDAHCDQFLVEERVGVDAAMPLTRLKQILHAHYGWALTAGTADDSPYFWYRSTQAPRDVRRGLRVWADGLDAETTMDTTLRMRQLALAIDTCNAEGVVAELLCAAPSLRHAVARLQSMEDTGYAELHVNYLARDFSPFAPVRLILSFYGMEKFEAAAPKSVRGAFLQGAPIAEDVAAGREGDWPFPLIPDAMEGTASAGAAPGRPMAAALPKAPPPAAPLPADTLIAAPIELLRLAQSALQAGGADLGVAEESASLVVFEQAIRQTGVEALLAHLAHGLRGTHAPRVVDQREHLRIIDAFGASALLVAPMAMDLASWQAQRRGVGIARVLNAYGAQMLVEMVLRCAGLGLQTLLMWDTGYAVARPSTGGVHFFEGYAVSAVEDQPARLFAEWLGHGGSFDDHALPHAGGKGFLLVCLKEGGKAAGSTVLRDAVLAELARLEQMPAVRQWTPAQTDANQAQWQRSGIALTRAQYDAATLAASRLHVPEGEEPRLRPGEDIDPLKVF